MESRGVFEILAEVALSVDSPPGSNNSPQRLSWGMHDSAPALELPKSPWPHPACGSLHLSGLEGVSELCPIRKDRQVENCASFSFPLILTPGGGSVRAGGRSSPLTAPSPGGGRLQYGCDGCDTGQQRWSTWAGSGHLPSGEGFCLGGGRGDRASRS